VRDLRFLSVIVLAIGIAAAKRERGGKLRVSEDGDERAREDEVLLHLFVGRPTRVRSPFGDEVGRNDASTSMVVLTRMCHFASRAETSSELPGSSAILLGLPARMTSAKTVAT
jgi:hypothetical protein